ncbi:MAG: hypothetical protein WA751_05055 [Candidatus Dormiibacterota bacterium]
MGPGEFQGLPPLPQGRLCSCGQRTRRSHLQYLGRGRSAPVYMCSGCGLVYRGSEGEGARQPAPPKSHRPLPQEGPPENPVLDDEVAAKLRQLLSDS